MSQSRSDKKNASDSSSRLYLQRTPDTGSQREIDEVVPEFMHRDFYRSTEDEFQVVDSEPRLSRKSKELDEKTRAVVPPIRDTSSPPRPLRSPESSVERAPLEPLRESGPVDPEGPIEGTVAVPLRTIAPPPQSPPPPSAARQPGINFSIVAALLFVVGLFIWREQTRPNIPPQQPLPIPQNSQVVQESADPDPPVLGEDSPYPEMSPEMTETVVSEPSRTVSAAKTTAEDMQRQRAATLTEDVPQDTTTYPSREASAQRAAIMQKMSDRTVTDIERTSRKEPQVPVDDSLFPAEPPQPTVSKAKPPTKIDNSEAAATEATVTGSLFPTDTGVEKPSVKPPNAQPGAVQTGVVSKPPAPPLPKPPVKANQPARPPQGEPYEIAEPTF